MAMTDKQKIAGDNLWKKMAKLVAKYKKPITKRKHLHIFCAWAHSVGDSRITCIQDGFLILDGNWKLYVYGESAHIDLFDEKKFVARAIKCPSREPMGCFDSPLMTQQKKHAGYSYESHNFYSSLYRFFLRYQKSSIRGSWSHNPQFLAKNDVFFHHITTLFPTKTVDLVEQRVSEDDFIKWCFWEIGCLSSQHISDIKRVKNTWF